MTNATPASNDVAAGDEDTPGQATGLAPEKLLEVSLFNSYTFCGLSKI